MKNKTEITELLPEKRTRPLVNLYLDQNIRQQAERIGRPLVYANYICDLDDVIAVKDEHGILRVPKELRNPDDWRLFQELEAQADVIILSRTYLKRLAVLGDAAQNILTQFEPGAEFGDLGAWRRRNGFASRSPDIAIVGRRPDILVPDALLQGRRVMYFTTYECAKSLEGKSLEDSGIIVVGAGDAGVEGKAMIRHLAATSRYRTICMLSGPSILSLLLDAARLDRLYLTRVHRRISVEDPLAVMKISHHSQKVSELNMFSLIKRYLQEKVITEDGTVTSQEFSCYERNIENRRAL